MNRLIGITGLARSGKDEMGKALARSGFKRTACANSLKTAVAYIANEPSDLYFDDTSKEEFSRALGMTRREAMQKVGMAIRETLGADVWVHRVIRAWIAQGKPDTVVTDIRFDNEAAALKEHGAKIIKVVRPKSGLSGSAANHVSEAGISQHFIDVIVSNDGDVKDLNRLARVVLSELYPKPSCEGCTECDCDGA